jgi:hypothetical protein
MAWDKIRREVSYKVNLATAHVRAELLNQILPDLQKEFETALNRGTILELESGVERADALLEQARAAYAGRAQ